MTNTIKTNDLREAVMYNMDQMVNTAYDRGCEDTMFSLIRLHALEPMPEGEAVYQLPDGSDVGFEENDAYWSSMDVTALALIGSKVERSKGYHLGYRRRNWTDVELVAVIDMYKMNFSAKKIAKIVARTRAAVASMLRKHGYTYIHGENKKTNSIYS